MPRYEVTFQFDSDCLLTSREREGVQELIACGVQEYFEKGKLGKRTTLGRRLDCDGDLLRFGLLGGKTDLLLPARALTAD